MTSENQPPREPSDEQLHAEAAAKFEGSDVSPGQQVLQAAYGLPPAFFDWLRRDVQRMQEADGE